eukprot:scaffold154394_cov30-Prasinocladus_malaysianus.AAC.1
MDSNKVGRELWHRKGWAPGVFVDTTKDPAGRPSGKGSRPLNVELMQMTARACSVCDKAGRRPFPSDKALLEHVEASHGRFLCHVCLKVCFQSSGVDTWLAALIWLSGGVLIIFVRGDGLSDRLAA